MSFLSKLVTKFYEASEKQRTARFKCPRCGGQVTLPYHGRGPAQRYGYIRPSGRELEMNCANDHDESDNPQSGRPWEK